MKTKKIDDYRAKAIENAEKTRNADKITVGDFLYLSTGCGKENGLIDYIRTPEREHLNGLTLVKVVDIVDVPECFDLSRGWMDQPAPEHRGGSQSDDVPEDHTQYNYTPEEIGTFFQLVTVYRNSKGQFIAVDCQDYNYWRYVYLPDCWRKMFADEVKEITMEYVEEQFRIREEEKKEQERHFNEYAARLATLRGRYPNMKENPKWAAGITENVKKWFATEFPGCSVRVSTRPDYYGSSFYVTVEIDKTISKGKKKDILERVELWNETIPTGERYEDGSTAYGRPMGIYGNILYGNIDVSFTDK